MIRRSLPVHFLDLATGINPGWAMDAALLGLAVPIRTDLSLFLFRGFAVRAIALPRSVAALLLGALFLFVFASR